MSKGLVLVKSKLIRNGIQYHQVSLILLVGALLMLLLTNVAQPVDWERLWAPILLFSFTSALTGDLGLIPSSRFQGMTPVMILTALLAMGLAPALWVAVLGTSLTEMLRRVLSRYVSVAHRVPQKTSFSAAVTLGTNSFSLVIAGLIYRGVGGSFADLDWTWRSLLAMVPLCGSYFLVHKTIDTWLLQVQGVSISSHYRRHLWAIVARQLLPLPLAVALARVYLRIDTLAFIVACSTTIGFWILSVRLGAMRRDLEKRLRELNTLNRVGQAIATSLELDILLNTIYHQVNQLMEADYFYIALYNELSDELTFPLVFENGERKRYSGRRARNGLTEYVIRQCRPVLIQEQTGRVIANLGLEVIGQPALSWLGVPVAIGDKVLGVISVQSLTHHYAYDEQDMALLSTLAAQAAVALENAQLYGQMRRRTAELALLNTVSTAVSSTLDMEQVLQIVVSSILPITVCQKSALYLLDSPSGKLHLSASQGLSAEYGQSLVWQDDAYLQRVRDQHVVIVPDITTGGRTAVEKELALREGYRALAEVSLVAQNELIGVLAVYYDHVQHSDLSERDLLITLANQAAAAIANARLYSRTDQALARRVEELSAIERIGRELTSTLEPQRVLDLVLEQAMNATNAIRGCIMMLDESRHSINEVSHRGYPPEAVQQFLNADYSSNKDVIGRVLQSGQLTLIRDVKQRPAFLSRDASAQAQLTVPILGEETSLGAINLESDQINGFDEQDASFVSQLATQTTVALSNAQLFQERSRHVEELSLLYQASLSLASSLESTDVLDTISRLAQHITNSDTVALFLYDQVNDEFRRASTQGYPILETRPAAIRSDGMTRAIVASRRPRLIPDTLEHPKVNPLLAQRGIRSIIGVPVMSRGEVLGVLYVNHHQPDVYTENDVRLVSALATQAGATIANVSLFTQVSEARDHLEAIINSTQEGILVLDNARRVVTANVHMESFSELHRDQLVGYKVDELIQNHPRALRNLLGLKSDELSDWVTRMQTNPTESFRRTFPASDEMVAREQRSRPRFTELFVTPVLDEMGQVIGRLMVFQDITEEKELEQMREDLTDMMVHDLRSPLTAVLSGLEMLGELAVDEDSDPLVGQAIEVAERSCQNMLTMVNTLLDISRLESGRMPLERAPAPFAPLAHSVVSHLSLLAAERDVTVRTEIPPDLPMVEIDNETLNRVLINFLDNALKFTPAGEQVVIRATQQHSETENVLLCSVSDSGQGISKEYQEKIFDRFAQVRGQAVHPGPRGSGLGLAFCKLAIEAHGGKVWVASEPGAGSTFYFTLPVADVKSWLSE